MKRSRSHELLSRPPTKRRKHEDEGKHFWNLNANCLGIIASFMPCFGIIDLCEVMRSSLTMRSKEPYVRSRKIIGNRIAARLAIVYNCSVPVIKDKLLSSFSAVVADVPIQVLFDEIWPNSTASFIRDNYVESKRDGKIPDFFVRKRVKVPTEDMFTHSFRAVARSTLHLALLKACSSTLARQTQASDWYWLQVHYLPMHGAMYDGVSTTIYNPNKLRNRTIALQDHSEEDFLGNLMVQCEAWNMYRRHNFVIENSIIRGYVVDLGDHCLDELPKNFLVGYKLIPVTRCVCDNCSAQLEKVSQVVWDRIRVDQQTIT